MAGIYSDCSTREIIMQTHRIAIVETGALKTQVLENASTENASTMQTFSQIKKVWYFTSFSVGAFLSGVGKWITDCFFLR